MKDNGSCILLYVAERQFSATQARDTKTNYTNEEAILLMKKNGKNIVIIITWSTDRM